VQIQQLIANDLGIPHVAVHQTIQLIEEGATTPFIARYRKERTHGLDEVQIEAVRQKLTYYQDLDKRKNAILKSIAEQDKLTVELEQKIVSCWNHILLEDLYLPYKPKRRTKASIAREKGLEPLAVWIMHESLGSPEQESKKYITTEVTNSEEALSGARDIIADLVSEDLTARNKVRRQFETSSILSSKVVKSKILEGSKYKDYFDFSEPLQRCPSHRVLALFRGEDEGFLRIQISPDGDQCVRQLEHQYVRKNTPCGQQLKIALRDAYVRLLAPSMENEMRNSIKTKADEQAIGVFAQNLSQLLLAAPLGNKRILAIDPGFRTGCKVVCLNEAGDLIADHVIYPHEPQKQAIPSAQTISHLIEWHRIEAIAIGNETAGRETEQFINAMNLPSEIAVYMVNENGASIYSASEIGREEFPDKDITVRGAVSIGRRLADPLAELVKIDPKSIGVGQYQHDVNQDKLLESLEVVVQHCVNKVGVNLNTASKSLLTHVSGLNKTVAQNIVDYRSQHGSFISRKSLRKIPRLGDKTYEQCAAFLRIEGGEHPLDNSAVHPESYSIVEKMAKDLRCTITDLMNQDLLRKQVVPQNYVTAAAGLPTIKDILEELAKPNRDPRPKLETFQFGSATSMEQLIVGSIVPGIVTNITKFGCFVDIGVKQDGMVHISQMANTFISDPNDVVRLQQQVNVKITELDFARKRIGLSIREAIH